VASAPRAAVLTRPIRGRWLGGVCAAIARASGRGLGWTRLVFAALGLIGGIGAIAYVACWLIMPGEGEDADQPVDAPGIVLLAQAFGAVLALALVGAIGAAATVFGLGWAVLAVAALILAAGGGFLWSRLGAAWTLLPVAALILPSVAVAASGLRLALQTGDAVVAPRALSAASYDSGLGTLLIDLRNTALPGSGVIPLRINAGVRRTIVALPHSRCVRVEVHYTVKPFLGRFAALLDGREDRPFSALVLFGAQTQGGSVSVRSQGGGAGPLLRIDARSMGGALFVRDYPDGVNPDLEPNWPGYPVTVEPRPATTHMSRRLATHLIRAWLVRRRSEIRSRRFVGAEMAGPCGAAR